MLADARNNRENSLSALIKKKQKHTSTKYNTSMLIGKLPEKKKKGIKLEINSS